MQTERGRIELAQRYGLSRTIVTSGARSTIDDAPIGSTAPAGTVLTMAEHVGSWRLSRGWTKQAMAVNAGVKVHRRAGVKMHQG